MLLFFFVLYITFDNHCLKVSPVIIFLLNSWVLNNEIQDQQKHIIKIFIGCDSFCCLSIRIPCIDTCICVCMHACILETIMWTHEQVCTFACMTFPKVMLKNVYTAWVFCDCFVDLIALSFLLCLKKASVAEIIVVPLFIPHFLQNWSTYFQQFSFWCIDRLWWVHII